MSFRPKFQISERIRSNLREIEKLKDLVAGSRIQPEVEAVIRQRATVEAVHSSTSIEGNPLDVNQVRAVISSDGLLSREQYAEIEVRNYQQALEYIEQRRFGESELSMGDVLELHRIITDGLLGKARNGKLRKNPVYIESGRGEVVYTAAEPELVEGELEALLDWLRESQFRLHPVVIAGICHERLVAIHPFADGNGRTARALTALYLAVNQYDNEGALVLDSYYATDRPGYYRALAEVCGRDFRTANRADLTVWLEYFSDGFLSALRVLEAEIRLLKMAFVGVGSGDDLGKDDYEILNYLSKFGEIGIAEAELILPRLDRRSVQRRLKRLVEKGYLAVTGAARDTKYVLKNACGKL